MQCIVSDKNDIKDNNPKVYCCRVCLDTKYRTAIKLNKTSRMLQLLEYCVGFTVNIQYTSHMLCMKCVKVIEKFAKFKRQCVQSEQLWHKYEIVDSSIYDETKHDKNSRIQEMQTEECEIFNSDTSEEENINEIDKIPAPEKQTIDQPTLINKNFKICLNKNKEYDNWNIECDDNKERKIYECSNCKKQYNRYKWLLTHMKKQCCKSYLKRIKHKIDVKAKNVDCEIEKLSSNECGLCDVSFSCDLKEHLDQHWFRNEFKCDLCNYCGKDFANMVTHRYTHCPKMKLRCFVCDEKKLSILSLQFHFRSVHLNKPGGYCTICDKTFQIFKTWKRHHRLHTEKNLFFCDHCDRKFLYRHEIESHLNDHSGLRQFVCEACGQGFKRISTLREHIDNLHTIQEPVKCEHCNKVYKCKNKLKIHMRNVAKDKPFICEVCSKNFSTETVLKKHMFWHTNERPFSCELCGLKYKAKGQLKVHMRNHTGVLPHKCADCGKAFATGTQLKRHKSVHTGIRAFKCVHCERSFHVKKDLLEHAAQHESAENFKLET